MQGARHNSLAGLLLTFTGHDFRIAAEPCTLKPLVHGISDPVTHPKEVTK